MTEPTYFELYKKFKVVNEDGDFICPLCNHVKFVGRSQTRTHFRYINDHIANHEKTLKSREYWQAKSEAGYYVTKEDIVRALLGDDKGIDYALPHHWMLHMAERFQCERHYITSQFVWYYNKDEKVFGIPFALTTNAKNMLDKTR